MSKVRVYEVARQLNMDQKDLVTLFQSLGFVEVRNHMSAVDADSIERVRRHLEKQKTPSVVEERIRPTVVKRKATAKPAVAEPRSAPPARASSSGTSAASSPLVRRSKPGVSVGAAKSQPVAVQPKELEVHALDFDDEEGAEESKPVEEAHAEVPVRVVEPVVPAVVEPQLPVKEKPTGEQPAPVAAQEVETKPAQPSEPQPPEEVEVKSVPEQVEAASPTTEPQVCSVVETPSQAQSHAEQEPRVEPVNIPEPVVAQPVAPPTPVKEPVEPVLQPSAAPVHVPPPQPERKPVVAAPVSRANEPKTQDKSAHSPQPQQPAPAPRPSQAPRTGIETWGGRPGVPMPAAPQSVRAPAPPVPRRVQYDPRANAPAGKPDARGAASGGAGGRKPAWGGKGPGGQQQGGQRRPQGGMQQGKRAAAPLTKEMAEHKKVIKIEEKVSLQALAMRMSLKATEVLMKLISMGMPGVNINSSLDADTAKLLAGEFGWSVEDVAVSEEQSLGLAREEDTDQGEMFNRPPIVTVMGHVDHGKTSLLDQIRKTTVAASEAGGITQHIGAYRVNTPRGPIAFLDTPGHAAFTQMRARGAQVTDIVVLVVAADDGVMPQTREAIAHAKAAKCPVIVAVNKIDKPGANPERVRRELAEHELVAEDWGGETIFCDVSAKTRQGVDNLLEMILLQSEVMDLRANPTRPATGHVLEALLDRGRGAVARVMVIDGTLHTGDVLIAGGAWGKVRAMTDDRGRMVAEAGPATPVEILGLSEVPNAGDPVHVVKDPKKAQEIALSRKSRASKSLIPPSAKVNLESLARRMAEADQLELRLIIKADVQGLVEAIADALAQLSTEKVKVAIINAGVGGITEGDVNLAVASKAIIVGFNVRPAGKAASLAETESIEIRIYNVIYNAVDDIKRAMVGLLGPTLVEKTLGKAEIRQAFHIVKIGSVAGCMVQEGLLRRNAKVRLIRDAVQIWEGKLSSLKRFKDDAKEVERGFECGLSLEGCNDFKVGDIVECFEIEEIAATL